MPFHIIRSDLTCVRADAIVTTAHPAPEVGFGCDKAVHAKAGPRLLDARREIGRLAVGEVAISTAFDLDAKFVLHAVNPVWQDGSHGEEAQLRRCYDRALALAAENGCESIAFPLLSAGNHGFPKPLALQIAIAAFSAFLPAHEMLITLVVFSREAFALSEKLFASVESFIDENQHRDAQLAEYGTEDKRSIRLEQLGSIEDALARQDGVSNAPDLDDLLRKPAAGFSETLLALIDRTGKKDSEIYKKANIDRKLFSKIRGDADYRPSKQTAVAFALALELDLEAARDLIGRAGYTLSRSSRFDLIVEYFISRKNYDIFELNAVLFSYDLQTIGG